MKFCMRKLKTKLFDVNPKVIPKLCLAWHAMQAGRVEKSLYWSCKGLANIKFFLINWKMCRLNFAKI